MNHPQQPQSNDQQAEFDRLLETHLGPSTTATDHLIPSSGFAHSVMDAIHQQTATPPPIPFPWKRLLPAAIAGICALLASFFIIGSQTATALAKTISFDFFLSNTTAMTISLIGTAIVVSLATIAISFKLTTGRFRN